MLNLILLLCIVLLLLPFSMKQTLKKVFPLLLAGIAVIFMVYGIENSSRLSIRALDEKNEFSEGTEVHIKEIWVNGEEMDFLHEYKGVWIEEENQLIWRSYDQIEGMTDEIQIELPKQAEVRIVFEKNKWRGKAFVSSGGYREWIDCYEGTGDSEDYVVEFVMEKGNIELYLKYGLLIFILILGMINVFFYFYRKRKGIDSFIKKEHEIWMDILKIVSAMMIVLIHSSGSIYANCFGEEKWVAALVINAIPRFAVPCFFMISGIVLLPKKYDMEQVKDKIIRVMIPLVFFSVLAILLRKVLWGEGEVIRDILLLPFRRADGGMWYAYQLIWIYISLPILTKLYQSFSYREREYFIGVTLLLPSVINYIILLFSLPVDLAFTSTNLYIMVQYWGILVLGRYLYDRYAEKKKMIGKSALMMIIGVLWIIGSAYYVSERKGSPMYNMFEELSLPVIFYSSGVLLFVYSLKEQFCKISEGRKRIIQEVASVSLGVYFMHSMVIWILRSFTVGDITLSIDGGIIQVLVCAGCYYLISLGMACLMKRIPVIKHLVV